MMRRSLISAVRPLASLRAPLTGFAVPPRHFSASAALGFKALFTETDNSELNHALKVIQDKIILPAYLPPKQRELIYDPSKSNFIQQNPVVIELDGVEHRFSTIDRFHDIPNSKKALIGVLKLMKTAEDWENLGTLLAGYKKAGVKLLRKHYSRIVRMAGRSRQTYAIIECAKQSDQTGFFLNEKDYVVQLISRINEKIIFPAHGVSPKDATLQAAKWSGIVFDLIQRPEHALESVFTTQLHFSPVIRGLMLFNEASVIRMKQASQELAEEELVAFKENVDHIINAWAQQKVTDFAVARDLMEINPHSEYCKAKGDDYGLAPHNYVIVLTQNIQAMRLAQGILGEFAKDLQPLEEGLENHLAEFVNKQGYSQAFGRIFKTTTGEKPYWAPSW